MLFRLFRAAPRAVSGLMLPLAAFASLALSACGTEDVDTHPGELPRSTIGHPRNVELAPGFVCPGAAQCLESADGDLYAAAGAKVVTPTIGEKLIKSASGKPWEFRATGGDEFSD